MTRASLVHLLVILAVVASSCNRPTKKVESPAADAYISDSGSVGFEIKSIRRQDGSVWLDATYREGGKLAKFGIEFGPTRREDSKGTMGVLVETGNGRFVAQPGSDASVLLAYLQKALQAKTLPSKVQKVQALPFEFVSLGHNNSQAHGGGFKGDPPGGWTAIKIFIGRGEQEGRLFVNFNPAIGKGQFAMKDPEYGDIVLEQLASVL
jgi:hypothetical protein